MKHDVFRVRLKAGLFQQLAQCTPHPFTDAAPALSIDFQRSWPERLEDSLRFKLILAIRDLQHIKGTPRSIRMDG
jgi:hypothetical protein